MEICNPDVPTGPVGMGMGLNGWEIGKRGRAEHLGLKQEYKYLEE